MSNEIVDQINKNVMPDDILFHLGDWSFGGIQNIWNFRKRLNVKSIFLSLGNHDNHIYKNRELPNTSFNHSKKIQAKDLFVDVQHSYNIQVHDQKITLCHYSMRTWYWHNKGSWMLFGHSHNSLHPPGKTMDVGVDVAYRMFGEHRPFKFQEIQKIMSKKDVKQEDHHSDKTNAR